MNDAKACLRSGWLAAFAAAAAIGLAACAGGSTTPHVASVGGSNGASSPAIRGLRDHRRPAWRMLWVTHQLL